jgi:hypothetical protein
VVDVLVRETNRYATQHLTCYLAIKTYSVRTTRFRNNLYQVRSTPKYFRAK